MNTRISTSFVALALLLTGCGPVAIGAAIGSAGGGGGGGGGAAPSLAAVDVFQPEDAKTLVGVRIAQRDGNPVRLRFEYDVGQGRSVVPANNLVTYDPANRAQAADLPRDAADNFLTSSSRNGNTVYLLWDHAADLGQVEKRNVTLFAVYADAVTTSDQFAAADGGSLALFTNRTVGREVGALTDLVLRRATNDPESAIVVDATLTDRGGDRDLTSFSLEYALTEAAPQAADFVAFPPQAPASVADTELPDGSIRSALTFSIDPTQTQVPLGAYSNFWVRLQSRETYPQERSDLPASVNYGAQTVLQLPLQYFGYAPRIDNASVINPGSTQTNAGDPEKPWLRLPISVTIANPSASLPMRVRLTARYQIDNQTFDCTPFLSGDPLSEPVFDLAPLEKRRQFVVWNVARDEGLGNLLVNDPPYSTPRLAQVAVTARRISDGTRALAGGSLELTQNAGETQLSTSPFVGFRESLLSGTGRIWSSGFEATQATRDLFYTRPGTNTQETILGLNQQFDPLQITPPPPDFDFNPPTTNGVYDIVATDFDPTLPDCLVWINSEFYYATWPSSAGVVLQSLGGVGASLSNRGITPVTFEFGTGAQQHKVAVFHTWGSHDVGGNRTVDVQITAVVRDAQGTFTVVTTPVETFHLTGTPEVKLSAVGGEFDGNANTRELVLGTLGTEQATAQNPGLLHMWTITPAGSSVGISAPQPLATMPPPPGDPTRTTSAWLMTSWRDDANTAPGLVVVRQHNGTASLNVDVDAWVLHQSPAGGFLNSWDLLTDALSARPVSQGGFPELGPTGLRQVFAKDIDGASQGVDGSDLMLVFERRNSTTNETFADVWLYARRAARPAQWRRILHDLEALDPATLLPFTPLGGRMDGPEFQLIDVNGDRLLDLVTAERSLVTASPLPQPSQETHYNYLASSLSGVAGRLRSLGGEGGTAQRRSLLPGLVDANGDGYTDVVSGGFLLLAALDGTYTQAAAVVAGPQSRQRVERILLDGPADSLEILVGDESTNAQNRVYRLSGIGTQTFAVTNLFDFGLGGSGEMRDIRSLTAPDTATRRVKDLVGLVGSDTTATVRRGRIDITSSTPTVGAEAMWNGTAAVSVGMALIRRTTIPDGSDAARETLVQDIVVGDASNPSQIVVLESHDGYAPRTIAFAGETVVRIAEASIDGDSLEDLCVLTEQNGTYRVRCLVQNPDPALGIGQPAAQLELARFQKPFGTCAVRALQFDRGTNRHAQGFLLLDEDVGGSTRSEVRLIRPITDPSGLALRVVRSPLDQPIDQAVDATVLDADHDQLIEVFGGQRDAGQGLQRLQTNVATPQ